MNKVSKFLFVLFLSFLLISSFSCKKSVPEVVVEEEPKKEKQEEKKEEKPDDGKVTEVIRKITEEQFAEALELIARAKNAMADVYDSENFQGAIKNLQSARDSNDSNPKEAFTFLDKSRKMSQDAYYNSFKKRALEKKAEAERLMADLRSAGADKTFAEQFNEGLNLYEEGNTSFSDSNYTNSFAKYSESVDKFSNLHANQDKLRKEFESKIKYVQDLIKKAQDLGAEEHAPAELNSAKENLTSGIESYRKPDIDTGKDFLNTAEADALKAIDITNKAVTELKRQEALRRIRRAGQSIEKAAGKEVITDDGKAQRGLDYKFEFDDDSKGNIGNSPNSSLSYRDVLLKAVEYIEKAKEAYFNEDYDMAIRYADIAQRIADSYSAGGIKTHYTVRLIPEKRDCLWRIAEYDFIYGNPFYWPMIWKTNKEKILNPDLIFPGQVFAIPEID